jgi:hypothetical protein
MLYQLSYELLPTTSYLESGVCSLSPDQFVLGTETRRTKLSSACNLWSHQFLYCFKSTPDITRRPAEVWKRMCQRTSLILACSRLDRTQTVDPGFNEKNVPRHFAISDCRGMTSIARLRVPLLFLDGGPRLIQIAMPASDRSAMPSKPEPGRPAPPLPAELQPQLRSSPDRAAECRQAPTGSGVPLRCWLPGQAICCMVNTSEIERATLPVPAASY